MGYHSRVTPGTLQLGNSRLQNDIRELVNRLPNEGDDRRDGRNSTCITIPVYNAGSASIPAKCAVSFRMSDISATYDGILPVAMYDGDTASPWAISDEPIEPGHVGDCVIGGLANITASGTGSRVMPNADAPTIFVRGEEGLDILNTTDGKTYVIFGREFTTATQYEPGTNITFTTNSTTGKTAINATVPTYSLPIATTDTLGGVKASDTLVVDSTTGVATVPIAGKETLGVFMLGRYESNLSIDSSGYLTVNIPQYTGGDGISVDRGAKLITLNPATTDSIGGIIVGQNLYIDEEGALSAEMPEPATYSAGDYISIYNRTINCTYRYTLPTAGTDTLGGVCIGNGITMTNGTISVASGTGSTYTLPKATTETLGGVIIGDNISVNDGTISVATSTNYLPGTNVTFSTTGPGTVTINAKDTTYTLPNASTNTKGGVYIGANISVTNGTISVAKNTEYAEGTNVTFTTGSSGVVTISATDTVYTLPDASSNTKGGVIIGEGISVSNGTISMAGGTGGTYTASTDSGIIVDNTTRTIAMRPATQYTIGGIMVGTNLYVDEYGTLSAEFPEGITYSAGSYININSGHTISCTYRYSLPFATTQTTGGVRIGNGVSATNGLLSLKKATTNSLGGVVIGSGITVSDGTISVSGGGGTGTIYTGGDGITVDNTNYIISGKTASASQFGMVVVGSGITVSNGTISVSGNVYAGPFAVTLSGIVFANINGGYVRRGDIEDDVSAGTCTLTSTTGNIYLVARYNTTTYAVTYSYEFASSISAISCPSGYTQYAHRLARIVSGTVTQSQYGDIVVTGVWL